MTTRPVRDIVLFDEVKAIMGKTVEIPDRKGYRGTGAPGKILEDELHIQTNNQDLPDAGRWEIKYTSDNSYLTLFHKDPSPREPSVMGELVRACGWDSGGRTSFRHTVWGKSARGFEVRVESARVSVHNIGHPGIVPYWDMDDLNNSAVTKLRNLLLVFGDVRKSDRCRAVTFKVAHMYSGFKFTEFRRGLQEGWIAVDFDARTTNGGIRNHGTKFRIKTRDVALLYKKTERVRP